MPIYRRRPSVLPLRRGFPALAAALIAIAAAMAIVVRTSASVPIESSVPTSPPPTSPTPPEACAVEPSRVLGDAANDLLAAVEAARRQDKRCGPPTSFERVCRALFVAARSDPLMVLVRGPDEEAEAVLARIQVEELSAAHSWALDEGLAASDGDLAIAFGRLRGGIDELRMLVAQVAFAPDPAADEALARAVIDRSDPAIVEPLAAAEEACFSRPP